MIAVRYLLLERPRSRALCCLACREAKMPSCCRSAPTAAYADEDDPFKVLVLSRTMFGVVVVDVANKNMPIKGAQVTLTSRYAAGKQLAATTDDEGTAIFEIAPRFRKATWTRRRSLTRTTSTAASPSACRATAMSRSPSRASRGGTAITAPTRPLSDGEPYFRQLTFDEWDIQYADATFMAMPKDDAANAQPDTHTFCRTGPPAVGRAGNAAHQ